MDNKKPILVIGGGIAGITAAVEIAEVGYQVILIEKEAYLGGNVIKMNNYFPKLCPPACGLEINFRRIKNNPRISFYTNTIVDSISGEKDNFTIKLKTSAQYINNKCTSCGKCAEVCPVERSDNFNYHMNTVKAAYLPHQMAFPAKYNIDTEVCKKEACNKCMEVCGYDAIDFSSTERNFEVNASSVILASGWKNYNASLIENLHYDEFKNVVTNVEFERLLSPGGPGNGKLERPSDGKQPREIAFVQCAGSRDENHLDYCSAVCCSASLKHALNILEKYPDAKVRIFYIDLRVTGRNEDFLVKVQNNKNIELIKGKVAAIGEEENGDLWVEAENTLTGKKMKYKTDMAVLATGIVTNKGIEDQKFNGYNSNFIDLKEGIYPTGCCKRPMDVSSSVKDATSTALKAIQN
jgi:quinone-modifying oxidoreductase, subunit QmoA